MNNSFPIEWSRQRRDAGHYLVATTLLSEHDYFKRCVTLRHRDEGPDMIDLEGLENWRWSSGERTLIHLFLTLADYRRPVNILQILELDDRNRPAAGNALAMACAPADRWDTNTQSYTEAF